MADTLENLRENFRVVTTLSQRGWDTKIEVFFKDDFLFERSLSYGDGVVEMSGRDLESLLDVIVDVIVDGRD
jgi:hypothetical protein